ncbi:MAG: TonB family protein [Elusimicrobiales bacterium]|nr:TonB family protein [Elusimicrobiales bacterium]
MRAYLLYSSSAHFLLLAALFFFARNSFGTKKEQAYYIDFIGPSKIVTMEKAAAAEGAAAAAQKETQKEAQKAAAKPAVPDEDDFSGGALPKPSILASGAKLFDPETQKAAAPGGGGTPLVTDSANFPYPWYITQVREALWNAWTERMPSAGSLRCTVKFTISRDGSVRNVGVEKSAGNRLFDNAAESAVQAAAPFAPLPDDFYEDRLTVHVEFKAMD